MKVVETGDFDWFRLFTGFRLVSTGRDWSTGGSVETGRDWFRLVSTFRPFLLFSTRFDW